MVLPEVLNVKMLEAASHAVLMSPSQLTASNAVGETTCFSGTFQELALDFKHLHNQHRSAAAIPPLPP
jgi:hypothetical protein